MRVPTDTRELRARLGEALRKAYPLEPLPPEFVQLGSALARKLDQRR